MNDEGPNGDQRRRCVDWNDDREQPVQVARHQLREPHHDSGKQQDNRGVIHHPVEELLPGIEAALWRKQFVLVLDVMPHFVSPLLVFRNARHLQLPQ